MAASVHFSGVRNPLWRRKCCCSRFPVSSTHIKFAVSDSPSSGLFATIEHGFGRRVLRVGCKKGLEALLRGEASDDGDFDEDVEKLACVMKFGGSSLASAERMREVADLVLRFRDERPVIVLSAMGKTTNNLLLVTKLLIQFRVHLLPLQCFSTTYY